MSEFDLINQYCHGIGSQHPETKLSVGDDAAVVVVPDGMELAISVDTMVAGVHFFDDVAPAHLAHKILAVNLSDMAAMGARSKWVTLALTLPNTNEEWLSEFSGALDTYAKQQGVQLIGGDTTAGPLTLSLQIMGLLPKGQRLSRSGAQVGHDVYVSNTIGDAALALHGVHQPELIQGLDGDSLRSALESPEPQCDLGIALLEYASACIDVSDGLIADLMHVAQASQVKIQLDVENIPLSENYQQYLGQGGDYSLALAGGDDYQLAFCAPANVHRELSELSFKLNVPLARIGSVFEVGNDDYIALNLNGVPYDLADVTGYQHF